MTIEASNQLIERLWRAQLEWTKSQIDGSLEFMSDDGYDYLDAALQLAQTMSMIYLEGSIDDLDVLLNTPIDYTDDSHYQAWENFERAHGFAHLAALACDGVAPAFYELNCPSLPKET